MRHLALVGPTASGKSAVAMAVAEQVGECEIVSLDSMQVYRGMDVGTAKASLRERARVPHHLVDVADPAEDWSVARTQRLARAAISDIERRGRRALLVGGTGLYVQAVVDGLTIPGHDDDVRAALVHATSTEDGLRDAYERLARVDPVAAARIEPGNRRRVVRALEVVELTGRPFSSFGPGLAAYGPPEIDVRLIGVWRPRADSARRIAERVAEMRSAGLLEEVRSLASAPGPLSRTASQAIGYKELLAHLAGDTTLDDAFDLIERRTRRLARRQRVWFRRDPRVQWVAAEGKAVGMTAAVLATWHRPVPSNASP